jgi:ribosomal protein S18 acetylase RimI-like enzyme
MNIRDAQIDDMDQLFRLWKQMQLGHTAYQPDYYRLKDMGTVEERIRAYFSGLVENPEIAFRVAESNGTILGHIVARIRETPPIFETEKQLQIETIVVDEDHRRQGIFRRLLADVTAWGQARKAVETVLTVDRENPAIEAYRALGFEIRQHNMVRPAA